MTTIILLLIGALTAATACLFGGVMPDWRMVAAVWRLTFGMRVPAQRLDLAAAFLAYVRTIDLAGDVTTVMRRLCVPLAQYSIPD